MTGLLKRQQALRLQGKRVSNDSRGPGILRLLQIVNSLPPGAPNRAELVSATRQVARESAPISVREAAELLGFDQKTIRQWLSMGILKSSGTHKTKHVDPASLAEVSATIQALRDKGKQRGFTSALWAALEDQSILDDPDVREGLTQAAAGLRTRWEEKDDGSWGPVTSAGKSSA